MLRLQVLIPRWFYLMNNWFGYLIIAIQWGTTIFGILYKIFAKKVNENSVSSFTSSWDGLYWLSYQQSSVRQVQCFGVLWYRVAFAYTVGAGFYAKKKPYFHMIWHLFILAASALQYIAIVYYMIKRSWENPNLFFYLHIFIKY